MKIKSDEKELVNNELTLSNSYCIKELSIYDVDKNNNEIATAQYRLNYEYSDWIKVEKRNSKLFLYIKENYSKIERYSYIDIESYITGEIITITIKQNKCDYKIECEPSEKKNEIDYTYNVSVYGGRKNIFINKNTISIIDGNTISEYDNSLYYTIKKDEVKEDRIIYKVGIRILGNFENRDNYEYKIPLIHIDDFETRCDITLHGQKKDTEQKDDNLNNIIENIINNYPTTKTEDIKKINKGNLESDMSCVNTKAKINTINLLNLDEEVHIKEVNGLQVVSLNINNDNKEIELIINTLPNADSLIVIDSKTNWIKFNCVLVKEGNEMWHKVNITCDKNYWKTTRKGYVYLTNAENQNTTLRYLIIQNSDGKISFE